LIARRLILPLLLAGNTTGAAVSKMPPLFVAKFPASGLITNEYAYWNPGDARARRSHYWQMDSGSLFARAGAGWTGLPDACPSPNRLSSNCTDSAIFRLTTRRSSFGDVRVSFRLRVRRLIATESTPAVDWDGVHIWLRYYSQRKLYYASVARRDGHLTLKKKCPGGPSNGGTYYTLADRSGFPVALGRWRSVAADALDLPDGSVRLRLFLGSRMRLSAIDRGTGCRPLSEPGKVGIRGDNADFLFRDFTVRAI
jgi:hypothetical protein